MVTVPKSMNKSLRPTVTPRAKLVMIRINSSNLAISRKDVMPNPSHKDLELRGD